VGTQRLDFAEFYRRSRDDCLRTVLISVGDQDTAQELVAEAFARACASWRTVSMHPAPAAWVGDGWHLRRLKKLDGDCFRNKVLSGSAWPPVRRWPLLTLRRALRCRVSRSLGEV
jgi:predicted RNA polymerase sigma factor